MSNQRHPYAEPMTAMALPYSRWCRFCQQYKPTALSGEDRVWYRNKCPDCKAEYHRQYRRDHQGEPQYRAKQKVRLARLRAQPDHIKRTRWKNIQRVYGITKDEWLGLYHRQGGRCALCLKDLPPHPTRTTHLDHNHVTNEARGILCGGSASCNAVLTEGRGIEYFERVLLYLKGELYD